MFLDFQLVFNAELLPQNLRLIYLLACERFCYIKLFQMMTLGILLLSFVWFQAYKRDLKLIFFIIRSSDENTGKIFVATNEL